MKLYSPSQILMSLLVLSALMIGIMSIQFDLLNINWILLPLALAIAIYYMRNEMDYSWHLKNPNELDPPVIEYLENRHRFYKILEEEDRLKFRDRLSLYLEARLFKGVASEKKTVPEDLKILVACHAVEMTLYQEDFLIGDFDRIFLYQHPFGSPKKQFLHIVETEAEDGVIILMTPYLINAINHPDKYYNIAYHAFGEAIIKENPTWDLSELEKATWEDVEAISGFKKDKLLAALGYEVVDLTYILVSLYFSHRPNFNAKLPVAKKELDKYFINK